MELARSPLVPVIATLAAAALGALFRPDAWYATLAKPDWTPPAWLFAPVWGVLYVMIALSGWLLWRTPGAGAARRAWLVQIVLLAAWTPIFFGLRQPGLALLEIGLLWLAIGACLTLAWSRVRPAALLLVPYWAWVSFAALLNAAIWQSS